MLKGYLELLQVKSWLKENNERRSECFEKQQIGPIRVCDLKCFMIKVTYFLTERERESVE